MQLAARTWREMEARTADFDKVGLEACLHRVEYVCTVGLMSPVSAGGGYGPATAGSGFGRRHCNTSLLGRLRGMSKRMTSCLGMFGHVWA